MNRRDHLREYILGCIRDNVFAWADIASGDAVGRVFGAMRADVVAVLKEIGKTGASNAARIVGGHLQRIADDLLPRRR